MQSQQQPSRPGRRILLGAMLAAVAVTLLLIAHRQAIYDWWRLRGYQPSATVAQLAADDKLTDSARRVFYVNHPVVQAKAAFAKSCPKGNKETAVLGCYIPDQHGVYVLKVTDPRLSGIEQVTAAHELLHAEYDRLDSATRRQVDGWLQDYYDHGLSDQTIKDQLASYRKTEPHDLVNEMHSIFGTQVASLPADLENYYKRYFTDRSTITGYYQAYQAEFTSRLDRIKQDDAQLRSLKSRIEADETDLKTRQRQLEGRQAQLEAERRAGDIGAYNAGVPAYNALVDAYNAEVRTVQNLVNQYNQLVAARNAIALEEQQLTQAISSNVSPIGQQ